jgi:hypothetical protein
MAGLRQEENKIKVIILDELNAASPNILIRLHEVLDALERGGEVVLSEDASEAVPVDKAKTKIIALMNPPGKGFLQRESLDPALLRRWVYQKEVTDLPPKTLATSVNTLFGLPTPESKMPPEKYLAGDESAATREILAEIPGMREIAAKYEEFHRDAKKLVGMRKVAQDQPQPFTYDDREEPRRVRNFVARFYRGDLNTTFQEALRYYYQGKLLDSKDKAKLEELIKHVEYTPPQTESKRRGLEAEAASRKSAAESLLKNPAVPEDIKQRVAALEGKKESTEGEATLLEAEMIMGDKFLGPEAIKEAFGIEVKEVPPIPFTPEELLRAQELGQQLLLCVDSLPDGTPLTMDKMREIVGGKAADGERLLHKWESEGTQEWYEKETFFQESPVPGWRLVSPEVVPNSTDRNYVDQTETLINYIKDEVYKSKALPEKYQRAIEEFTEQKEEIADLLYFDWKQAGDRLQALEITSLVRESAQQTLYRLIVSEKKYGKKALPETWSWTATRSSDGLFVSVGSFDAAGLDVLRSGPGVLWVSGGGLGACLSRS